MHRRWSKPLRYSFILGIVLCSGVMLSGCDILDFLGDLFRFTNGNEAQAQQDGLVETFLIRPGSFALTANNASIDLGTNVEIKDQVTIYTQIDGSISFILSTGSAREFREVVERRCFRTACTQSGDAHSEAIASSNDVQLCRDRHGVRLLEGCWVSTMERTHTVAHPLSGFVLVLFQPLPPAVFDRLDMVDPMLESEAVILQPAEHSDDGSRV